MSRLTLTPILLSSAAALLLPAVIGGTDGEALAADPVCRVVDVKFTPQGLSARGGREELSPQIAVWAAKPDGAWVADLYVTRAIGSLGLGNRPGQALLKSDFRWPYGRRPMALPIWAHGRAETRQKTYGFIAMGGSCSPSCPVDFQGSPSDDDTTVAYHGPVSSTENYYCSPSGWRTQNVNGVDVVSCASAFYGSKGWYVPGKTSVYPPRADLKVMGGSDSPDVMKFARDNDVAAISAATPPNGQLVDSIRWYTTSADFPDGDYLMQVEVNIEMDFNASWPTGKAVPEPHSEWNHLGKDPFGQPSILYRVPFKLGSTPVRASTKDYAGYGDWRGDAGTIHPPDATISQSNGSGADRLKLMNDGSGDWRVQVVVTPIDGTNDIAPLAPERLDLNEKTDSTLTVAFKVPEGTSPGVYQIRYQPSGPITDENWDQALPAMPINIGAPGSQVSQRISGLLPKTKYYVAVLPMSRCGKRGSVVSGEAETASGNFTTLSGCFIATAAYGSQLEPEVATLRRFRDRHLTTNPLGQILVGSYYALSPSLASLIAQHEPLREAARDALAPVVQAVKALDR
jgi:hypothetical protein